MGALTVDTEGAVAFGLEHPDWYIFPGALVPDGEGGFMKRPLGKWTRDATRGEDSDGIREVWNRLVGKGKAVVCVACDASGIWVLDDDRDLPPETGWPEMLESLATLTLRSCTKGRPHYVFRVGADGTRPKEGKWAGGDVKSMGIVFIGEGEPIHDLPITVAPQALLDKLDASMKKGGGAGREAASSEEMWDWLTSIDESDLVLHGEGPERFLDVVLQRFRNQVDEGDHRRQACRNAVWAAAKESAAGFYKPDDAYREIREVYRELREETPTGHKGWTKDRSRDYDLMWAGVIAAILAGDLDDEIAANLEAIDTDDEDEVLELLGVWDAANPDAPVKAMDESKDFEAEGGSGEATISDSEPGEPFDRTGVRSPQDPGSLDWAAISDSEPSDTGGEPESSGESGDGGGDEPPRAWAGPEPEPEEPPNPHRAWASPADVPSLASADGERPRFPDDSPVWDTVHGKIAKALGGHGGGPGAAEVSDVAILAASLTYAGTHLSGRATHYFGADAHNPVVWSVLVGRSAAARKSMALSIMNGVFYGFPEEPGTSSDPRLWEPFLPRKVGGFNSGEVLIDSFLPPEPVKATDPDDDEDEDEDEAYYNPRAIAVESELDRLWTAAGRDGSVLSVVLCNAWDGSTMSVRSRGSGVVEIGAGNYVLGLLGAATESRAISAVARNEGQMAFSGLANRYLWFSLPDETPDLPMSDGALPWTDIYDYRDALELRVVRSAGVPVWGKDVGMTDDAIDLWHTVYPWLKRGSKRAEGELAREALSRAEAQVRRLALNFAVSRPSGTKAVNLHDLQCALAIWEYCRSSVRFMLAPERALEAPGRYDTDVRRAIWSLLSDPTHPGWGSVAEISEETRKDRGTVNHHVKRMMEDGLLIEGVAITGKRGKPPRVVALRKRHAAGKLGARSEGKGAKSGLELHTVTWG